MDEELKHRAHQVLTVLGSEGLKTINVSFYGGGDEGSVNGFSADSEAIEILEEERNTIEEYVEALANQQGNWYDNEGGSGDVTFDLVKRTYVLNIGFYESVLHENDPVSGTF